jgi:hypothetical protein
MVGKTTIDGLGLTDVNLDPCPYHVLISMGGLKEARRLTKQEIVIQVNPTSQ